MFVFLITTVVFLILWLTAKKKCKAQADSLEAANQQVAQQAAGIAAANQQLAQQAAQLEQAQAAHNDLQSRLSESKAKLMDADAQIQALSKYKGILDADAEAQRILTQAQEESSALLAEAKEARSTARATAKSAEEEAQARLNRADEEAKRIVTQAEAKAKSTAKAAEKEAQARLTRADEEARRTVAQAEARAVEISGGAYELKQKAAYYEKTAQAMQHIIEGYGDEWLVPTYSLLDELAEEFSYADAGKKLKEARAHSAAMVKAGTAATCDYVEAYRRNTAIAFVVDAFNGKVDSILSKSKQENYGKMEQQIRDAFFLVNRNGSAFRKARITEEYLLSRLEELRWAVIVKELRTKELEEQRRIREQIREEERARREYEKAQREAEKEAAMLAKAMKKAKKLLEQANAEERAKYEAQIIELSSRLKEVEEKGQRALSLAQQTKRGNVYIISNIGSFGENVYKVGMTRRLDPMDRVRELGDASVPFAFDVHAIIESNNAPALEHQLHQELALMQMNKVNPRKEFYKVPLTYIRTLVERHGLSVTWTMAAEAAEYRETLAIEERMKNDPEAQAQWEAFYAKLSEESEDTSEDAVS